MGEYTEKLEALPSHRDDLRDLFGLARTEITAEVAAAQAAAIAAGVADNQTGKVIDPEGVVFPPTEMTETG